MILNEDFLVLSVIIVNYNVKYFLEQCLCSVQKAIEVSGKWSLGDHGQAVEVIVVDNNSIDGSLEFLQPKFPWIQFISNKENKGFAKANNQALSVAKGKYVLFLNPDTIVAEDSFEKCILFMESNADAGAVGVRMIDGSGHFLKESKRGFPTPWVSFCKLSGITTLFPHSKLFAKYYFGHLNENENNPVDVLSGAFMLVKKETIDKTGGFDEQFFMYAEDIDLGYRIKQAGYKNYYFADTTIIHFKGESTHKDFRYVKLFYKAMNQFAHKHFRGGAPRVFTLLIKAAIWFRGRIAVTEQLFKRKGKNPAVKFFKTFLTGDENNKDQLEKFLSSQQRSFVQNKDEANEIIFCEGNEFSFKRIIELLQKDKQHTAFKIHANGSNSIVGSDSKDVMGEVIAL